MRYHERFQIIGFVSDVYWQAVGYLLRKCNFQGAPQQLVTVASLGSDLGDQALQTPFNSEYRVCLTCSTQM